MLNVEWKDRKSNEPSSLSPPWTARCLRPCTYAQSPWGFVAKHTCGTVLNNQSLVFAQPWLALWGCRPRAARVGAAASCCCRRRCCSIGAWLFGTL